MKKIILSLAMVAVGSAAFAQISAGTMMLGGTIGINTAGSSTETSGAPAGNGTVDGPSTFGLNFSPTFGYFLNDNLAIGGSINFGSNTITTKSSYDKTTGAVTTPPPANPGANDVAFDQKNATSGFGINLFANMYNDINGKWMWYYGAGLGFGLSSGTNTVVKETAPGSGAYTTAEQDLPSTTTISLGANLGIIHFLNDNWALQAGLTNLVGLTYAMGSSETTVGPATVKTSTSNMNLTLGTGSFGLGGVGVGVFYFLR